MAQDKPEQPQREEPPAGSDAGSPPDASARFSRSAVVEALVLACSRTRLTEVVGADAMVAAVNNTYLAMARDGELVLQPLWDLFALQPGFDPEPALDAMCKIESWAPALRLEVGPPQAVNRLGREERQKRAQRVEVSDAELARVLGQTVPAGEARRKKAAGPARAARAKAEGWRRWAPWVAGLVAAAGFAVAGGFLYQACRPPAFRALAADEVSADIPLRDVKRIGQQVVARLADAAWIERPPAERERELRAALEQLDARGITSLVVLDDQNVAHASIQVVGGQIYVRFY
jgi:hypothetical protein